MVVFVIMFTVALFSSVFGIPSAHAESWHETADIQDYGQKIIRREILTPPPVFIIPPFITGELITENDYMIFDEHGGWWYDAEKTFDNEARAGVHGVGDTLHDARRDDSVL